MENIGVESTDLPESTDWISARTALQLVSQHNGQILAATSIRNRACSGLLRSWALLFQKRGPNGTTEVASDELPSAFWQASQKGADWASGDFSAQVSDRRGYRFEQWRAFGVMFDHEGVEAMLAPAADAVTPDPQGERQAIERNTGGRPAKDWEAVMVEMAGQLYCGDLQPKAQGDIEQAILRYFESREESIGETTARDHARLLWRRLNCKDENPSD